MTQMGRQEESGGFLILASSPSGPPDLHQRTSMLPRCCHQSRDSLACEERAGEGRRPEGRGHAGGHTEGRSGSGQFHSSTPHSAPQPHRSALPTAPLQHVQQVCPQAHCTLPSPHTACQRNATRQPWATSPHFLCTCWGLQLYRQVLLTPSQEFTQHSAAHHTHSSEGENRSQSKFS